MLAYKRAGIKEATSFPSGVQQSMKKMIFPYFEFPSVLWHCWLGNRKGIQSNMSMHHYRCVELCFVNMRQKGQFWAASLASGRSMPNEDRSLQTFRTQVECGLPEGLLQLSDGCANRVRLASTNSFIRATCPNRDSRRDLTMEWRSENCDLDKTIKLHLYNAYILSMMLYGSECWMVKKADVQQIDALDQWCLRTILDSCWHDFIRNDTVRGMTHATYPKCSLLSQVEEENSRELAKPGSRGRWRRRLRQ